MRVRVWVAVGLANSKNKTRAYERGRVERRKEKKARECEKDAVTGKGGEGGCERGGADAGWQQVPAGRKNV